MHMCTINILSPEEVGSYQLLYMLFIQGAERRVWKGKVFREGLKKTKIRIESPNECRSSSPLSGWRYSLGDYVKI